MKYKEAIREVHIVLEEVVLHGNLYIPEKANGMVVFSHGSGSSRWSPRNNYVANKLYERGLATLLFDLLTEREDVDYQMRFDIDLLSSRLVQVTRWLRKQRESESMPLAYFGASTGAASALRAASELGDLIKAVVSRGGRPDLAMSSLPEVTAATLFIVGGKDHAVIELNKKAFEALRCERKFELIPNASHLFEEPGKLEEVARISADWFMKYLKKPNHAI